MTNTEIKDYVLDVLQNDKLEIVQDKNGNEKWCLPISDRSGRDFHKYVPVEHLEDSRINQLADDVFDDIDYEYPDEVDYDDFIDIFEDVLYSLNN